MTDNSDYTKPRTNLFDLLPEVYKSDTNRTVFENLFNRFLTKQETEKVSGYIGEGNPSAIVKRQIQEFDVHRQAYQLQPILHNKIGSVEWMSSWKDLLNEAERLGIDPEAVQDWLNLLKFNWAPPIDIDKLIHYRDYYWYDEDNPSSKPQYITIRSRCATATSYANFQESLVEEYGESFPVNRALAVDDLPSPFTIQSILVATNQILVVGDITSELSSGQFIEVDGTLTNNGVYQLSADPTYDSNANRSVILLETGSLSGSDETIGKVHIERYNKFVVVGDYGRLLEPGFVFFFRNSSNDEIDSSFITVVESVYDETIGETTVTLSVTFTDRRVDGVISLSEKAAAARAARDCQCTGSVGWDVFQWDDNPLNPSIWNQDTPYVDGCGNTVSDFATLIASISHSGSPTAPCGTPIAEGTLWWDTDADKLYQYTTTTDWKLIWNSFSVLVEDTRGAGLWDLTLGCGIQSAVVGAEQWINENKWLHKTDVPNFAIARQAAVPIIEYDWDLELNEWTYTTHKWKYRSENFSAFEDTSNAPDLIEVVPIVMYDFFESTIGNQDSIILDERYGDLTEYFTPGRQIVIPTINDIFTVVGSSYMSTVAGTPAQTRFTLDKLIDDSGLTITGSGVFETVTNDPAPLRPLKTSIGDSWEGYNVHWLYVGVDTTVPVVHQPRNILAEINTADPALPGTDYDYWYTYYAQQYYITTTSGVSEVWLTNASQPGTTRNLRHRALVGENDIRVYINGIRQYGTYTELTECDLGGSPCDDMFVAGIQFNSGYELKQFDELLIEVGPATPYDFGWGDVDVRTIEDDIEFALQGTETHSLIRYRKEEQVKTQINQYPLFDMYRVDGTPAYKVSPLFGYVTGSEHPVNGAVQKRLATGSTSNDFIFEQFLVEDDGTMYAYRDYYNQVDTIWVDLIDQRVYFWDGLAWSEHKTVGQYYMKAIVSDEEPGLPWSTVSGVYWLDTQTNELKIRNAYDEVWESTTPIYSSDDPTLQTIWKKGLNDELYVPVQRDWDRRTLEEYTDQMDLYVSELAEELMAADSTLTEQQANEEASSRWYESQSNHLSVSGEWVGDWELPDPLYYNYNHENRRQVAMSELITHFDTIIEAQPKVPGYTGPRESMFHLIPTNEVNYGLGGTIREFNYGFDTFLSSLFNNQVSPRALYEFAQDQYEVLLNSLKELYRRDGIDLLTTVSADSLSDLSGFIVDHVIEQYEQNDVTAALYGDTTAFVDVPGADDLGVRNWIATLPILGLVEKFAPAKVLDEERGLNQIIHHDGHRNNYFLADATIERIARGVVSAPDLRTVAAGSTDEPKTFGVISTTLPPNNTNEFEAQYDTLIANREGVFWYTVAGTTRTLYRLEVAEIGTTVPSSSLPDGTMWIDLRPGLESLRVKTTNPNTGTISWDAPDNIIPGESPLRLHNGADPSDITTAEVSAWVRIDLNDILTDIIYEVERRLFNVVPEYVNLKYDMEQLQAEFPVEYRQYLEEQFLAYVSEAEIVAPFSNSTYDATDPFTWNYKYSTIGRGYPIVDIDVTDNAFIVSGHVASAFDPCQQITPPAQCSMVSGAEKTFYIKNNGPNDGTWTVTSTFANPVAIEFCSSTTVPCPDDSKFTKIFVSDPIENVVGGVAYIGQLPSTANDGSESGGDWRDLYQKFFGTPYPHLEPWSLQSFASKPEWWDEEYYNDDHKKWGDRRWKYKHGFDIADADVSTNAFIIDGDFREVFDLDVLGSNYPSFNIDSSPSVQDGTWKVGNIVGDAFNAASGSVASVTPGPATAASLRISGDLATTFSAGTRFAVISSTGTVTKLLTSMSSYFTGPPSNETVIVVEEAIDSIAGFDYFSGATYDPSTNETTIRIDTTATLPTRNNITVGGSGGRIAVAYGMWNNVTQGIVPAGYEYPNGELSTGNPNNDLGLDHLPTYSYVCVNISNHALTTGGTFQPDDVLPPYWKYTDEFGTIPLQFDRPIRSLFTYLTTEIIAESADFAFGDAGYVEWVWRNSSQFLYDQLTIAFRIDPVRFFYLTFGPDYYQIGGLLIEQRTEQVLSHTDTEFHGDIINSNDMLSYNGVNQWYVDYLRYTGIDLSMSDFRPSWTQWTAPLMYQFASFVDTPSLDVAHRNVCISEFDYRVAAKRSPGAEDYWLDSFDIYTLSIPPKLARYDNEAQWKFEITTKPPYTKTIQYYDVQNYQFYADPDTDLCTLYSWMVADMSFFNDTFSVKGDQTDYFTAARTFDVVESTDNDGMYTVVSSVYNAVTDQTLIQVSDNVQGIVKDGRIILNYRTLPWTTGEAVVLSTHETLPLPLQSDNVNGVYQYYFIRVSDTTFRLATTRSEAELGNYVNITSTGRKDHFVGKILTTFTDGVATSKFWRHYALDKTSVLTFMPPKDVSGFQSIINIVDGYEEFSKELGWRVNNDNSLRDPVDTSLAVNWQQELRRFMQFNYNLRSTKTKVEDRFPVTVEITDNTWTITDGSRPQFITGDAVTIYSSSGVYPVPLIRGGRYYMIRDEISKFRLAATKADAVAGIAIDITDDVGTEKLFLTQAAILTKNAPRFEMNPFRNAIWFRPERGIVSNIIKGPTQDVFTSQLIVDQYGRPLSTDAIRMFREDKETKVLIEDGRANDVELTRVFQDPYNYIHLGALHLFVDTYEHVMIFNDDTTEGQLIYDPFVGLNLTKFEMLFNRQVEFTQRPNVGGQYLSTFFNQGADLNRNIEASIEDLRNLYDTYRVIEANEMVQQSRKTLGYEGRQDFLDNINLNAKSQFAYWRGQVQHKGAMTSVQAFINSRRFIDAKVDEYWAYKVGEFGSSFDKEYLEMWLKTSDARNNELRLQFVGEEDLCDSGYASNAYDSACGFAYPTSGEGVIVVDEGWTGITIADQTRWVNYPDQAAKLINNGGILYFDLKLRPEMMVDIATLPQDNFSNVGDDYYIRHNFASDFVTITGGLGYADDHKCDATISGGSCGTIDADGRGATVDDYVALGGMITVFKGTGTGSGFVGQELVNGVDYIEVLPTDPTTIITNRILFASEVLSTETIRVVYNNATLIEGVHYDIFTTNIVKYRSPQISNGTLTDAKVWGWLFDKESLNPHKIIDTKSETVLSNVQYWDPARGHHYYNANHIIDLRGDTNPAKYSNTPETAEAQCLRVSGGVVCTDQDKRSAEDFWNKPRVGTTWLDTSRVSYVPYFDPASYVSENEQFSQWGNLADWADVKIYTWVESDVPPEEWNALAEAEEGNISIDEKKRKSGRIYKTLFKKNGSEWEVAVDVGVDLDPIMSTTFTGSQAEFDVSGTWTDLTGVDLTVYVNGRTLPATSWEVILPSTIKVLNLKETDRVRVIEHRPGYNPTLDDATNAANLETALGGLSPEYMEEYQYSTDTYYDRFGIERSLYYFWVEDKVTRGTRSMSVADAQETMKNIPIPYAFYVDVQQSRDVTFENQTTTIPVHFAKAVLRGIRDIINDNDRYMIRWTRDMTLRDTLDTGTTALEKKNLHAQWDLIRREMPQHIPRELWDKITESIVGYLLADPTIRVPSYQRELYDTENGTDTRYGLGNGQAFVNGDLALATIIADLNNPDNDFSPVDINVFFQQHNFDTAENIVAAMNTIYNTFPFIHVNRMFFDVLLDAFSTKRKYEDIFKTSMIALHGIRPFQVGGLFDD